MNDGEKILDSVQNNVEAVQTDIEECKGAKSCKKSCIGGQAVLEGVMMRGKRSMAVAVRDEEGIIRMQSSRFVETKKKNIFFRIPIIRGVVNFISTMIVGVKTTIDSAEIFGEEEPSKFEKWCAQKLKIDVMSVLMFFSVLLGIGLAVGLFFILPSLTLSGVELIFGVKFDLVYANLIEGGIRLFIFIGYLLLVSLLKPIKRMFKYHGAEHKVISCYEKGMELNIQNAQKCSTLHNRCGTTFMFFVMLISIVVYSLYTVAVVNIFGADFSNVWARIGVKIALLPLIAGLSYELLKLLALSNSPLLLPLKAPGLLLQKITTGQPTNAMVEVALVAFKQVLKMDEDLSVETQVFVKPQKRKKLFDEIKVKFDGKQIDNADLEWIYCDVLNCKRGNIFEKDMLTISQTQKINDYAQKRLSGEPLQYILGETEFYGYKIKVNKDVLIPRFDTEILADEVIKQIANGENKKVLDLCCGSGAIAISVQKQTNANIVASDVCEKALAVAKKNAIDNNCDITFKQSDMFNEFTLDDKFDIIVSNPPYIETKEIEKLENIVKDYEPLKALDGGADGLNFYRQIAENGYKHLNENGVIFLEVGFNQAQSVMKLFETNSEYKAKVEIIKDLNGIDRILKILL